MIHTKTKKSSPLGKRKMLSNGRYKYIWNPKEGFPPASIGKTLFLLEYWESRIEGEAGTAIYVRLPSRRL